MAPVYTKMLMGVKYSNLELWLSLRSGQCWSYWICCPVASHISSCNDFPCFSRSPTLLWLKRETGMEEPSSLLLCSIRDTAVGSLLCSVATHDPCHIALCTCTCKWTITGPPQLCCTYSFMLPTPFCLGWPFLSCSGWPFSFLFWVTFSFLFSHEETPHRLIYVYMYVVIRHFVGWHFPSLNWFACINCEDPMRPWLVCTCAVG